MLGSDWEDGGHRRVQSQAGCAGGGMTCSRSRSREERCQVAKASQRLRSGAEEKSLFFDSAPPLPLSMLPLCLVLTTVPTEATLQG